jgi:K+-sensing histidine kinase KdpD
VIKKIDLPDNFSNMLISVLAHDLRQPFATFIMILDAIKYNPRTFSMEELGMMLEEIRFTASESIELLDGVLYWMKLQKTGSACQIQPLLLNSLIQEANSLYLHEQHSKAVCLNSIVPEYQLIYAHKQMLQFINRNILSNATKYSPCGGTIGVTCSIDESWITVTFTDDGAGMTADQLGELFHIKETENPVAYRLNSAGIAMNICQDMIRQMNGKLWAESIPGKGTVFYYSLPLRRDKAVAD